MTIREFSQDSDLVSDRSAGDRGRHRQKVRNAIKENLGEIISEEAIIGQSGDKKIKVPIKGIKEYRFVFGSNQPGVSQGNGNEAEGDIIPGQPQNQPGAGQAGSEPGDDIYETEVTLDELTELLFEDLELPNLEKKKNHVIEEERLQKRKGYRPQGIRVRLSRKKTVTQRIKRKQASKRATGSLPKTSPSPQTGLPESAAPRFPFHGTDLRYNRVMPDVKRHSNAVIFCIMDTSGSMDTMKKYLARSFYFLLWLFIKSKYQNTKIVFIAHHAKAEEVTQDEFFHRGESGGTKISSGYKKVLEIIESHYHPAVWNIYAFHCSDGDNFDEDNEEAIRQANLLAGISNLFGYGEIKTQGSYSWSSMLDHFKKVKHPNFMCLTIHEKRDLWPAFMEFLGKDRIEK